jgi:hypothetical protein
LKDAVKSPKHLFGDLIESRFNRPVGARPSRERATCRSPGKYASRPPFVSGPLLSSCSRVSLPVPTVNAVVRALNGVRVFGRDELTGALADRGLIDVEQRVTGLAQFVSCSRPLAG